MRILYGVQGTGNGHITRARAMQKAFAGRAVKVDYLFSGRARTDLFDMDAFGDFLHRDGLSFAVADGRILPLRTLAGLKLRRFLRDVRELDLAPYDLVLTDFEPVTAWAGRRADKTVIGAGHQYAFHYPVPVAGYNPLSAAILRHFAPADIALGFHWHHFDQPVLPPLFEAHRPVSASGEIVVYLPFEDTAAVCALLAGLAPQRFVVYSPAPVPSPCPHIRILPLSRDGFRQDLAACSGVICNTGFELISEALQLGKKVFTKPVAGQMEQLSNARALQVLGRATVVKQLQAEPIRDWLAMPAAEPLHYPDVATAVVDWLLAGDWQQPGALAAALWAQTEPAPLAA